MTVSAVRPWRTALPRERSLPSTLRCYLPGAFERVAAIGRDLSEGAHEEPEGAIGFISSFGRAAIVTGLPAPVPFAEFCGSVRGAFEHRGAVAWRGLACADPTAEIGEDHDPETHLIPLVFDAASGKRSDIEVLGTDYPTSDGTAVHDYVHVADLACVGARVFARQWRQHRPEPRHWPWCFDLSGD